MPGYYDSEILMKGEFTLQPEDLAKARLVAERQLKPMARPWVRAGMLLTASVLLLAVLPQYYRWLGNAWFPASMAAILFLCALWVGIRLPKLEENALRQKYASNSFRFLPFTLQLYRDSFSLQNEYQTYEENWVDFSHCFETREYFIAAGGDAYRLLVLKKEQMTESQQEDTARCLEHHFAGRYRKLG